MPRQARIVFPNEPHHITQRGNRRNDVFFSDEDRQSYLEMLLDYSQKHAVDIVAYCLMTNHNHMIAVPKDAEGLQRVLKPLHMRYAQYINRQQRWSGHLWQGRFFSSCLDEEYLWFCMRYVERNPVRAGMVTQAEDYQWSSVQGHCGLINDKLLNLKSRHNAMFKCIDDWSLWLRDEDDQSQLKITRRSINKNLPCGSD